jgi:hypothetical protein
MKIRTIKIAVITAGIAAAPMLSVAANSPSVVNSCVKAFMTQLATKNPSGNAPKLRSAHYIDNGLLDTAGSNEMELTAWNANNNHVVARALCTYNAQGEVTDLQAEPLAGPQL